MNKNDKNVARIKNTRCYSVLRDYRATVEELISGGNIEILVHENLIKNFTSSRVPPVMNKDEKKHYLQEKQIYIISFSKNISTNDAIQKGGEQDLVPADIFDLLALNNTYPQSPGIKKEYALPEGIIALGTLFPKEHNGKIVKGAYLAPLLLSKKCCNNCSLTRRRVALLNLTVYVDDLSGCIKESSGWWPTITHFAYKLK